MTEPARGGRQCHIPMKKAALASVHAPDIGLPLRFMVLGMASLAGVVAFLVFNATLLTQYHYSPHIIAVTHWFLLGFVVSIVSGALYQLTPVALETRLHSPRLARWHFVCQIIGVPGMVFMFWQWNLKQVGHFGSVFALGVGLLAYNIYKTLRQIPRRTPVSLAIGSATFWLTAGMLYGLYLASAKCWPRINVSDPMAEMHAHVHTTVLGCFIILILGVSYRLVPMFTLGAIRNERRAVGSILLLDVAVAGLAVTITLQSRWKLLFAAIAGGGFLLYALEMRAILATRKRKPLDWGLKTFLLAITLLAPLTLVGLALASPLLPPGEVSAQLENVYGILAIPGVITLSILGMMQKILPFLVWYHTYAPLAGRARVPALSELGSERLPAAGCILYLAGLGVLAVAAGTQHDDWATPAWGLIATAVSLFLANAILTLSHWGRRTGAASDLLPGTSAGGPAA